MAGLTALIACCGGLKHYVQDESNPNAESLYKQSAVAAAAAGVAVDVFAVSSNKVCVCMRCDPRAACTQWLFV